MLVVQNISEPAKSELAKLHETACSFSELLSWEKTDLNVSAGEPIILEPYGLYRVKCDGAKMCLGLSDLALVQDGDLILSTKFVSLERSIYYKSEFVLTCDFISMEGLRNALAVPEVFESWISYLSAEKYFFSTLAQASLKQEVEMLPEISYFEPGDKIISQGDTSSDVFTMLEGEAAVVVKGEEVGRVKGDEIFGAIAGLTESVRTADIVAKTGCSVLCVSKENFYKLLKSRPETAVKLVSDLSRALVETNSKIVGEP